MDNSSTVNMRRRNSQPVTRSTSMILMRMSSKAKSNPYVGTFRHAPPTASSATWERSWSLALSGHSIKSSPYVGTLRHAPPRRTWLETELCRLFLEQTMIPETINGVLKLTDLLSGHLKGGGRQDGGPIDWQTYRQNVYRNKQSLSTSSGGTSHVLTRLACWLLLPFHQEECPSIKAADYYDEASSSCSTNSYDTDVSEDLDMDSIQDSYDSSLGYCDNDNISNSVISSQAEAYYAHQATTTTKDFLSSGGDDRLDYTITQMDVIRMMRNASRHLDVESIMQLPVYTYQKDKEQKTERDTSTAEESWLLVQKEVEDGNNKATEERDVCVICLEHFCDGDRVRVLPCNHSFHVGCIDRWLSGSLSFDDCFTSGCPTCKKRPDICCGGGEPVMNDGSVPSWAFARIGDSLARSSGHQS